MLRGIDVSNHQGAAGFKISNHLEQIDFCICKATEGDYFVDAYCDVFVQTLMAAGKKWGFYHFAGDADATAEADYFIKNTLNYFGKGIPVLDWEGQQTIGWVNAFVKRVYEKTRVWPWIYANPWRFQDGGVESNCGRWAAQYPNVLNPPLDFELPEPPDCDGLVACWQYCSDGRLDGYSGNLDFDRFYGDNAAWDAYASGGRANSVPDNGAESSGMSILENDEYRVTIERI